MVESPFQLLCAIEAKEHFKTLNNTLIILDTGEKNNLLQIKNLLDLSNWDIVHIIPFNNNKLIQFLKSIQLIYKFKKIKLDNLFIGEFRSDIMWLFVTNAKYINSYLLDDGSHTIHLQNNTFNNLLHYNKGINSVKKNLLKIAFLNGLNRKVINLFTIYDFKNKYLNQNIIKNNFNFINTRIDNEFKSNQNIYFIGTNMVENNMLEEDYFFIMLKKIIKYYGKNKTIIYIPHRREKKDKLKNVEKLNIQIKSINLPIEIYFLLNQIKPNHIASFASTALYTLSKIYSISKVDSFEIDFKFLKKEYHEKFRSIYSFQSKYYKLIKLD